MMSQANTDHEHPAISIVVSCFNGTNLLRQCLVNLLQQTVIGKSEVLVIDSGSTEDIGAVCNELRQRFPRMTFERTDRETLYTSWNRALIRATGKYFVNANTDDALHPAALQMLADALESQPDADLAYGDWMWSTVPNATYPWDPGFRRCVHPEYHPSLPLFYAYAGCHQFWRTDKLRELGGFNVNYKAAGDYDALCRLSLNRGRAVYINQPVSAYYQNPNGISRSSNASPLEAEQIKQHVRNAISLQDIYGEDCQGPSSCASAYVDLGKRALALHIPWSEQPTPDTDFAVECAMKALRLDPENKNAAKLLTQASALSKTRSIDFTVTDRLRRKLINCKQMIKGVLARFATPSGRGSQT